MVEVFDVDNDEVPVPGRTEMYNPSGIAESHLKKLATGFYGWENQVCVAMGRTPQASLCSGGGGCIRRERTSEAAPEAVRQAVRREEVTKAVGRFLSVTNAIEAGTWRWGGSGWA